MATITVKDIPDELYAELKKVAAAHHRSINREVIHCIQQAVQGDETQQETHQEPHRKVSVEEVMETVRRIQAELDKLPIGEEIVNQHKQEEGP